MITLVDISAAVSRVLSRYDVREAYLFGSFARGEQTPDSDIDLRLVCEDSMTFGTLYELSLELEEELGREVEIVTNPPEHMRPAFRKTLNRMRCVFMKRRKRDAELIDVILSDCETLTKRIDHFGSTESSFVCDRSEEGELAYDAIMSPVYRIAEDALHLPDEVQSAFPEYPWNDIRGFCNFVAHGYREVDRSLAWKVIVDDIPELEKALRIFKERQS